jgi:hypothetical protein
MVLKTTICIYRCLYDGVPHGITHTIFGTIHTLLNHSPMEWPC